MMRSGVSKVYLGGRKPINRQSSLGMNYEDRLIDIQVSRLASVARRRVNAAIREWGSINGPKRSCLFRDGLRHAMQVCFQIKGQNPVLVINIISCGRHEIWLTRSECERLISALKEGPEDMSFRPSRGPSLEFGLDFGKVICVDGCQRFFLPNDKSKVLEILEEFVRESGRIGIAKEER